MERGCVLKQEQGTIQSVWIDDGYLTQNEADFLLNFAGKNASHGIVVNAILAQVNPDYDIYVGGCHVAVHERPVTDDVPYMGARIALITW